MYMWCLGTWFTGGLSSVRLMVRLDDFKGPFQPKYFYSSMKETFCFCSKEFSLLTYLLHFFNFVEEKDSFLSFLYGISAFPMKHLFKN